MAGFTVQGTRLYIGSVALADIEAAADALADFTALSAGVEIGLIESIGNFGKVFQKVVSQTIANGRTYKFKGGYDQGAVNLVLVSDLSDPGQALLQQYGDSQDQLTYPMKMTLNGAPMGFGSAYFGVKVFSYEIQMGPVNTVVKAAVNLEINTDIFFDA